MTRSLQLNPDEFNNIDKVLKENGCVIGESISIFELVNAVKILAKHNLIYRVDDDRDYETNKIIGKHYYIPEKIEKSGTPAYYEYSAWESSISGILKNGVCALKSNRGALSYVCSQLASMYEVKVIDFDKVKDVVRVDMWSRGTVGNMDLEPWCEFKYKKPITFINTDFEIERTLSSAARSGCTKVTLNGNLWLLGSGSKQRPATIPDKFTLLGNIIIKSGNFTYKGIKEYNERDERLHAVEQKLEVTKKIDDARKKRLTTFKDNYGNQIEIGSVVAFAGSGTNASVHLGVVTGQTEKMVRIKEAYNNNSVTKYGHQIVRLS